ncbi:MAG: 2OG-Fe(II) oxygenase [Acidobacteriota bacterium]|nr:2OG-Fe(II) oxygenase [Acidobacteriota bacterium]
MIQLTQTAIIADPESISRLANEFEETGCAALPGLLAPEILKPLLQWLETARFEERNEVHENRIFGTTQFVPETERALFLLQFILNRPALFDLVRQISACPEIGNYIGRIHRTGAESSQHIDWHRDAVECRALGLCVNLSAEEYTGGLFQIRDPGHTVRAEIGRQPAGDAFLFRIDLDWQHRLTQVKSGRRTVGVGWFRTAPDWRNYAFNVIRSRQALALAQ